MNFDDFFNVQLDKLKQEGNYRHFAELQRLSGEFPHANLFNGDDLGISDKKRTETKAITVWCSNDYLGMGQHPMVIAKMQEVLGSEGAGAGGTRNISGTNHYHVALENRLAKLHQKEAALIFTSGYVANWTTLSVLGRMIPNLIIYSDAMNHNSMIEGIKLIGKEQRRIIAHNDANDLRAKMAADDPNAPKMVAFESVYSMDADLGKIKEFLKVAKEFKALTYLDEVHAVGMYGDTGAGIAEQLGVGHEIDIIQGTLGKAFGVIGGYITASTSLVDFVRSYGAGFIFTTALPPAIAAGALISIELLAGSYGVDLRKRHQERANSLKQHLLAARLPMMNSQCHIIPLLVGDANKCRLASQELLDLHQIYVQPINYPTVAKTTERLRLTPTPHHSDEAINHLIDALKQLWQRANLPFLNQAA